MLTKAVLAFNDVPLKAYVSSDWPFIRSDNTSRYRNLVSHLHDIVERYSDEYKNCNFVIAFCRGTNKGKLTNPNGDKFVDLFGFELKGKWFDEALMHRPWVIKNGVYIPDAGPKESSVITLGEELVFRRHCDDLGYYLHHFPFNNDSICADKIIASMNSEVMTFAG